VGDRMTSWYAEWSDYGDKKRFDGISEGGLWVSPFFRSLVPFFVVFPEGGLWVSPFFPCSFGSF
jgi:hypothetical protein